MKLTAQQVLALKRKQGEKSLSITSLAQSVGIGRQTMGRIIKQGTKTNITPTTSKKIINWIIDQYTTIN